jgi:hypothetical protein
VLERGFYQRQAPFGDVIGMLGHWRIGQVFDEMLFIYERSAHGENMDVGRSDCILPQRGDSRRFVVTGILAPSERSSDIARKAISTAAGPSAVDRTLGLERAQFGSNGLINRSIAKRFR